LQLVQKKPFQPYIASTVPDPPIFQKFMDINLDYVGKKKTFLYEISIEASQQFKLAEEINLAKSV